MNTNNEKTPYLVFYGSNRDGDTRSMYLALFDIDKLPLIEELIKVISNNEYPDPYESNEVNDYVNVMIDFYDDVTLKSFSKFKELYTLKVDRPINEIEYRNIQYIVDANYQGINYYDECGIYHWGIIEYIEHHKISTFSEEFNDNRFHTGNLSNMLNNCPSSKQYGSTQKGNISSPTSNVIPQITSSTFIT